jgi:hypothetical protein
MKNHVAIAAVLTLFLSGCSVTHIVDRAEAPMWGPDVSDRLSRKNVDVVVRGGAVYRGEILKVDGESIVQRNKALGADTAIPLDSVLEIKSGSNVGWTVLGVLGGAIMGGLVGSAIGLASGPAIEGDITGLSSIFSAAAGGAVGLLVGGVAGGVGVGLATQTHNYSITHAFRPPRLPGSFEQAQDSSAGKNR